MSDNLKFLRLTSEHAPLLSSMEDVYPEGMKQGLSVVTERLQILAETEVQMSWICLAEEECAGYLVAYPAYTQLSFPNPEFVIYIDDLQVTAGYEQYLFRLLELFTQDLKDLGLESLAVEGVCRRNSYKLFKKHDSVMNRLGWELEAENAYWEPEIAETLTWLRWKPCAQEVSIFDRAHEGPPEEEHLSSELEIQIAKLTEIMEGQVKQNMVKIQPQPPVKIVRTQSRMPGFGEFQGNK